MPHSSGGGSHGGGFHSSSHSSSSRGGSGASSHPISTRPYAGASRYRYRTRSGGWGYVYYAGSRTKPDKSSTIVAIVVVTVILLGFLAALLSDAIYSPKALDLDSYDSGSLMVSDPAGLVTDMAELTDSMYTFMTVTGITPGVEVVTDSQWKGKYSDLETYAYSEYMSFYDDEKHWLFVISYPDDYASSDFVNWSWEGMIGDDCESAVDENHEDSMTEEIQRQLLRVSPEEVGTALAAAFTNFSSTCMEKEIYPASFLMMGIVLLIYGLLLYSVIHSYKLSQRLYTATPCPVPAPGLKNCEYCGSVYDPATDTVCKSCGAPIPVEGTGENR